MKKFLALLLSVMMLLTMTAAFAEDGEGAAPNTTPVDAGFTKQWTFAIPLEETLTFDVEFISNSITGDNTLPEPAVADKPVMPTSITLPMNDADHDEDGVYNVPFTVNLPKEYGTYIYKITENIDNPIEHVTYDEGTIYVAVMYTNEKGLVVSLINEPKNEDDVETAGLEVTDKVVDADDDTKNDRFENQYDVGSFEVSKTITGNASNPTDTFMLEITFTSDVELDMVNITMQDDEGNDIPVALDNGEGEPTDYMAKDKTYTITCEIGDGETLFFDNIPQGVTVTVVETNQVKYTGLNYYVPTYELVEFNADTEEDVRTEVKEISFEIVDTAWVYAITNTKTTDIPTGVELDSIPYIVLLAVATLGAVAFIVKRRMAAADED